MAKPKGVEERLELLLSRLGKHASSLESGRASSRERSRKQCDVISFSYLISLFSVLMLNIKPVIQTKEITYFVMRLDDELNNWLV